MRAHAEDLRAEVHDRSDADDYVAAIAGDFRSAPISDGDRALCELAHALTLSPSTNRPEDLEKLRKLGFSDTAIHDAVQVIALFAYYNRIADGLGIADEPEWTA